MNDDGGGDVQQRVTDDISWTMDSTSTLTSSRTLNPAACNASSNTLESWTDVESEEGSQRKGKRPLNDAAKGRRRARPPIASPSSPRVLVIVERAWGRVLASRSWWGARFHARGAVGLVEKHARGGSRIPHGYRAARAVDSHHSRGSLLLLGSQPHIPFKWGGGDGRVGGRLRESESSYDREKRK
jgi:hypothetical protein